jgi:hypothetical protein
MYINRVVTTRIGGEMTQHVLEVATFSTVPGTDPQQFVALSEAVTLWLRAQPGFLARRLGRSADDNWIDIVEWADEVSATKASEAFFHEPSVRPFYALIDSQSVKLVHHALAAAA